jgi:hypothetical protein
MYPTIWKCCCFWSWSFNFPFIFLVLSDSKDEFRPLKQVYDEADVPGHVRQSAFAEGQNSDKSTLRNEYSDHGDNIPFKQSSGQSDSDV